VPNRTFFEGVFQVPPGHYLIATGSGFQILRYWDFDYPRAPDLARPLAEAAYIEQFRETLNEAVRIRMRADVPVGCYLSGGLDSCSVLGMAATHTSTPIQAFTLTFDQKDYDEGKIAGEMAARAGAKFCPIPIKQSDIADHLADALWHSETLFINGHGVSKFLLSRAVNAAGYKVVFTGEGSDEILGGYAHFRRDMLLYNTQGQDAAQAETLLRELEVNNRVSTGILLPSGEQRSVDAVRRTLGFVPTYLETIASAAHKTFALLADEFISEFSERDGFQMALNGLDVHGQLAGRDPVNQSLYIWSKSNLPNYILNVLGDRMEMAHSIEGRVPFLDHHLVEVICSQPVNQKIRGMTEKFVLREAVRDVITDTVYRRQKHPFLSPPATLNPEEKLSTLVQDTLRGPVLASIPYFDQKKVVGLLDSLNTMDESAQVANDQVLMLLVSACVLQERFHLAA
jgi:asparagine synthase (glutamine-hydrolysing)